MVDVELSDTFEDEVDSMAPGPRHGRLDGTVLGLIWCCAGPQWDVQLGLTAQRARVWVLLQRM